jgi:flagellar basal-body rod protein FlgG
MRALYVAATGMTAQQTRIDTIADNLANAGTTGFKKGRAAFEDVFYQQMAIGGDPTAAARADAGGGVRLSALQKTHVQGALTGTGDPYHLALEGPGFFVFDDAEGAPVYGRDGTLRLDADGRLVNGAGLALRGDITVPLDATSVSVAADGTVEATVEGEAVALGRIDVAVFQNPAGLVATGGNLYRSGPGSGEPIPVEPGGGTSVRQGFVESSNVDAAEELIELILAQRAYELNSKVVQAADETLQVATQVRR